MAVRDAIGVRAFERVGDACADAGALHVGRPQPAGQQFVQRAPIDALDDQEAEGVAQAGIEDGDDVRMLQAAGRLRLAHERLFDALALVGRQLAGRPEAAPPP